MRNQKTGMSVGAKTTIMEFEPLTSRLESMHLQKCAEMLKAIAHPIRMTIIDMLGQKGKLTVTEIYEALNLEQAVVSHHLSIMRDRGVLLAERQGKNTLYAVAQEEVLVVMRCIESCNAKAV